MLVPTINYVLVSSIFAFSITSMALFWSIKKALSLHDAF